MPRNNIDKFLLVITYLYGIRPYAGLRKNSVYKRTYSLPDAFGKDNVTKASKILLELNNEIIGLTGNKFWLKQLNDDELMCIMTCPDNSRHAHFKHRPVVF